MLKHYNNITSVIFGLIDRNLHLINLEKFTPENKNEIYDNEVTFEYNANFQLPTENIIEIITNRFIMLCKTKSVFSRIITPCIEGFEDLEIKKDTISKMYYFSNIFPLFEKQMIAPYYIENNKLTLNNFDDLVEWVKNNSESKLTKEKIIKLYMELIKKFDEVNKRSTEGSNYFKINDTKSI